MSVRRRISSSRFGEKGMAARIRGSGAWRPTNLVPPTSFRVSSGLIRRDFFQSRGIELPANEVGARFEVRHDQNSAGGLGIEAKRAEKDFRAEPGAFAEFHP